MIVVSDTSPLLCLCYIGEVELLSKLFHEVVIPDAVYNELMGSRLSPDQKEIINTSSWISIKTCTDTFAISSLLKKVDYGEAEAIVLAHELHADFLLIDEDAGRKVAMAQGIRIMGVLGVLIQAKKQNFIPQLKPLMDKMRQQFGFYISDSLYNHILGNHDK